MDTIDDIGRRAAALLHAEADASADPDVLLAALLAADIGSQGGRRRHRLAVPGRRPRTWAVVGAAAAVVAAAVAAIMVVANREPNRELVPSSSVPPSAVPTSPIETSPTPSTDPPPSPSTSTAPASTAVPATGDGLAVSYKNPPPFLEPIALATLQTTAGEEARSGGLAVMESGVVVLDGDQAHVLGWDGAERTVDVPAVHESNFLSALAAGPGDVLYAIASGNSTTNMTAAEVWAIPLSGDRTGEVVASTPIDMNVVVERPAASFGHGPSGLLDRIGRIDGVVAPYVDEQGQPWPEPLAIPVYRRDGDLISNPEGSQRWPLQIERARGAENGLNGAAAPIPAADGGAIWWDVIGPRSSNGDYALGSMPVMAFMIGDGTATWRRIPDGWEPVAADVWGTVLARRTGTTLELALATPSIATTPSPTPAEQAVTDYVTALASRDYETAAVLLGNGGLSLADRPDLAVIRPGLGPTGGDLAGALREWCEGTSPAACWMPVAVSEQAPTGIEPEGSTIVAASYGDFAARFVVSSREGQRSVFGLPPLVDIRGLQRARQLLGLEALYAPNPQDGWLMLVSATGSESVRSPLAGASVSAVTRDGYAISWTTGDPPHTTLTDTHGTVLCEVDEQVLEVIGGPGAYRAIVTREGAAGSGDAPAPQPAFEIDCASGAEGPTDPWTWIGGPVYARKYLAGDRAFVWSGTDHGGRLATDDGNVVSGEDNVFTEPALSADGSVVAYGSLAGSANPWLATHVVARDATTGDLLWDREIGSPVNALWITDGRVVVETGVVGSNDEFGTAGLTLIELATGEEMLSVPAAFDLLFVG